ncbi:MAG: anti-sigma factor domain-containing protein [Jatrophihabitans sp.]
MTNNHISDDLPLLLTGDATRDAVIAAAAHLRACVDCQQELVSAVVAHASLTSAHRFAPEIVTPDYELQAGVGDPPPPAALPDLSDVFAEARAGASVTPISRMRGRRALVSIAAAAAIVVGGGVTYAALSSDHSAPSTRTVALTAFDTGHEPASVQILGNNKLKVDASKLPKLDSTHLYEVWLTDNERRSMQSVGFIGDNNTATLSVSPKWMSQYSNIEVSVQGVNQDKYSHVSVLRGSYG